jgi:hypothetical protein
MVVAIAQRPVRFSRRPAQRPIQQLRRVSGVCTSGAALSTSRTAAGKFQLRPARLKIDNALNVRQRWPSFSRFLQGRYRFKPDFKAKNRHIFYLIHHDTWQCAPSQRGGALRQRFAAPPWQCEFPNEVTSSKQRVLASVFSECSRKDDLLRTAPQESLGCLS